MKRILITGANGYLGGHVLEMLCRTGHSAIVTGLNSHGTTVYGEPVYDYTKVDALIHLAWYSSVGNKHPEIQHFCIGETKDLVCELRPDCRVIFSSSASVYGDVGDKRCSENTPVDPNCAYTLAKVEAETFIRKRLPHHHLILRFGSFMGMGFSRTKTDLAVNAMATDGWLRKRIEVWNPEAYKPLIHVRDAAGIIVRLLERRDFIGTYNAASTTLQAKEIAEIVREVTGAEVWNVPDESGPRSCVLDSRKLLRALPRCSFKTVRDAVKEFQHYHEMPGDKNIPWPAQVEVPTQ